MKFINKKNGRIYATGRLEISKIENFKRETGEEKEILFTCEYDMSNILPANGKGGHLQAYCFCVCYIGNDNLLSLETSVCKSDYDTETLIRLTPYEKELLLCWIVNHESSIKD